MDESDRQSWNPFAGLPFPAQAGTLSVRVSLGVPLLKTLGSPDGARPSFPHRGPIHEIFASPNAQLNFSTLNPALSSEEVS